jgi:hypothetical protein
MLKRLFLILLLPSFYLKAQVFNCTFKAPLININFGTGDIKDLNQLASYSYSRVPHSCPSDGHYTYTSYTSDCFRGDWITLTEDHTPGDASGNMMLVNASYRVGEFLGTLIPSLKPTTIYEFSVWMLNVCKPSDKCPYPLLPNIIMRLQTPAGKSVMQLETGEIIRRGTSQWTQYRVLFTSPATETVLYLSMVNTSPGGCGNDFALDDITIRECTQESVVNRKTPVSKKPTAFSKPDPGKNTPNSRPLAVKQNATHKADKAPATRTAITKKEPGLTKPLAQKGAESSGPQRTGSAKAGNSLRSGDRPNGDGPSSVTKSVTENPNPRPSIDSLSTPALKPVAFAAPPPALTRRENTLVKKIETEAGQIKIDLYDNGEIDGDTVTIYHNNRMVVSRARLSQKALTLHIDLDAANPHHELVMVANNLGSIPPNTSLMIVTAGGKRHEVFISSNEQHNAKVVVDLKD